MSALMLLGAQPVLVSEFVHSPSRPRCIRVRRTCIVKLSTSASEDLAWHAPSEDGCRLGLSGGLTPGWLSPRGLMKQRIIWSFGEHDSTIFEPERRLTWTLYLRMGVCMSAQVNKQKTVHRPCMPVGLLCIRGRLVTQSDGAKLCHMCLDMKHTGQLDKWLDWLMQLSRFLTQTWKPRNWTLWWLWIPNPPPHVSSLVREHMGAWQPGSVRTFDSAVCFHRAAHIRQRSSASFPTNWCPPCRAGGR